LFSKNGAWDFRVFLQYKHLYSNGLTDFQTTRDGHALSQENIDYGTSLSDWHRSGSFTLPLIAASNVTRGSLDEDNHAEDSGLGVYMPSHQMIHQNTGQICHSLGKRPARDES